MVRPEGQGLRRTVGLLCGGGELPLYVVRALRRGGARVVAVCIRGEADPAIENCADEVHWTGLARLGGWIKIFRDAGVASMLMAGGIRKRRMFEGLADLLPDWRSARLWFDQIRDRRDHNVLGAVADEFEKEGIRVGSVVDYCPELLARRGCLTRQQPTEDQWADVRFAWPICKRVAAMQIGQCIVVKERAVMAVEAIEGTDAALQRGGELAGGGAVAVKLAREGHDVRFDIPCIGTRTVETLKRAGVAVLAIEAGGTIVLGQDEVAQRADEAGICIVAVAEDDLDGVSQ